MTNTIFTPSISESGWTLLTCRKQNQIWSALIVQYEQEIDQLIPILTDLFDYQNYTNLYQRAVDYYAALLRLKGSFMQLNQEMVCTGANCSHVGNVLNDAGCGDNHFLWGAMTTDRLSALADELVRLKNGCYQFLSLTVTLNLI